MLRTVFKNRKELVKAVSEFTGENAEYMGAPTFSYKVEEYTINKDGIITSDTEMDSLKSFLTEKGFVADTLPSFNDNDKVIKDSINEPHSENYGLTVSMPRNKVSIENLVYILKGVIVYVSG